MLGASWTQYQFVVDDSYLYYFDAAESANYDVSLLLDSRGIDPLGTMQLELTVVANTKSARGDRWAMRLNSEGRKWIDAGESQEESRQWAEALEQQLGVRNTYDPSRQGGGPDESGRSESSNRSTSQRGASNRLSSHRPPSLWMDSSRRESSEKIGEPPSLTSLRNFFTGKPAERATPTSTLPPPTPPTSPEPRVGPAERSLTSMLRHEQFGRTPGLLERLEERKSELSRYTSSMGSPSSSRATSRATSRANSRANSRAATPAASREPSAREPSSWRESSARHESSRRNSSGFSFVPSPLSSLRISLRRGSADGQSSPKSSPESSRRGSQEPAAFALERARGGGVEVIKVRIADERASEGVETRTSEGVRESRSSTEVGGMVL